MSRTARLPFVLALLAVLALPFAHARPDDPLPSWTDGTAKKAVLDFVQAVTKEGGPEYVAPEERIAVFDNDGTLWCEQPVVQLAFVLHGLKAMATDHPEWRTTQPFQAALEGDMAYLEDDFHHGGKGLMELLAATHTGMSQTDFAASVRAFFESAKHPRLGRPYDQLVYQPMLELLRYLRANGFETWIVSGGGIYFMRVISEKTYGIVPQNVVGSHMRTVFKIVDGKPTILREAADIFIDDKAGKPVGIDLHIGRVPIIAAGNVRSGGDVDMLTYCQGSPHRSLQLMVNHDDAEREFAYAEKDDASLGAAAKRGWQVVSMKRDWKQVFPPVTPR